MSKPDSNATTQRPRTPWDPAHVVLALGLLITAIIYLETLNFQFVYDDLTLIVRNPQVQSWRYLPYFFKEHLWASVAGQGNYYRPVFQVWLLLNHTFFGLDPMGWHLSTVAVHLGVTLLTYLLVLLLGGDRMTAAVAATLFGVHPVHIESVAWVAGVCDSLLSLFFLGALVSYLMSRKSPKEPRWRVLTLVLYALALLTKEVAGMLPVLVFGYEWIYGEAKLTRSQRARTALVAVLPFAAVTAAYLGVRWLVLPPFQQPQGIGARQLLLTIPAAVVFYIRQFFWPVGLSVYYDFAAVARPGIRELVLPCLVMLLAVAALVWINRQGRLAAFAVWWIALLMLPPVVGMISFPKDELVHDRYLYLLSVGFVVLLALGFQWCRLRWPWLKRPQAVVAIVAAVASALGAATVTQNLYWANERSLFERAVAMAPRSVPAADQLANELYKHGQPERALQLYRHALQLDDNSWMTYFSLGVTEFELEMYADSEQHLRRATELSPRDPPQYYFLAVARMKQGKWSTAEQPLGRAIELAPAARGLHYALGLALANQDKLEAARDQFAAELKLDPSAADARRGLEAVNQKLAGQQPAAPSGKP